MGARPSSFKRGGGFLNNVDGVIADYEFTTEFPGGGKQKKAKNPDWHPLYCVLSVLTDGAKDYTTTTLNVGSADDFEVEGDGKILTPVDETVGLPASFGWQMFIASLIEAGFPETNLPDDDEPIDFSAILGSRVRFVQRVNEEVTKKYGKRKGKDGKGEYNRTDLTVDKVYSVGDGEVVEAGKAAKAAPAGKGKPAVKAAGKPNGAAKVDVTELADETLLGILADNEGEIMKSKLPVKIAQKMGVKHPQREEVRRLIYSDDYLNDAVERGIIAYDQASKQQTISAA